MANGQLSRRHFFYGTLLAGAIPSGGFGTVPSLSSLGYKSPNEKLSIAMIGAGGRAAEDLPFVSGENIVAFTDPDARRAAATFQKYEKTPKYTDFRKMLDKEGPHIDAVLIAIPDHMHGTAAMWCIERGKHVYVEKPLTKTVWEARRLREAAAKYKVATQMGNQGYSNEGARQACEIIWSGEIGNVTEVHCWTNRPIWPQGMKELPKEEPVPDTLDWPSWLGGANMRPYSSAYLPFNWRGWLDFGTGALGDMACHLFGAPNMALRLTAPSSVEVTQQDGKNPCSYPNSSVTRWEFPARGAMPPVRVYWYDASRGTRFRPPGVPADEPVIPSMQRSSTAGRGGAGGAAGRGASGAAAQGGPTAAPNAPARGQNQGAVFCGDKGYLAAGGEGASVVRLLPESRAKDYVLPPQVLTRSPGHYQDWIRACKGGEPACSNFNISGLLTEWVLLGCVALNFEGKLEWDSAKMKFTNNKEANQYLKPRFHKGWRFT